MLRQIFITPIAVYFGFLGYLFILNETYVQEQLSKGISQLPPLLNNKLNFHLSECKQIHYFIGGYYALLGFSIFTRIKTIIRIGLFIQKVILALLVYSIYSEKPEMQALSEQLERIAYQLCVSGFLFASLSDKKQKKKVKDAQFEEGQVKEQEKDDIKEENRGQVEKEDVKQKEEKLEKKDDQKKAQKIENKQEKKEKQAEKKSKDKKKND